MARSMPRAGRAHKTPGTKAAPRKAGLLTGGLYERAGAQGTVNPLGAINGPQGGTGQRPRKKPPGGTPKPAPQGGAGS